MCKEWLEDKGSVYVATKKVALLIVGFNYIIRVVSIRLIATLKLPNWGRQGNAVTLLVFAATGINTAVLLVLASASAIEVADYKQFPALTEFFPKNGYTDFSV